MTGDEETCIRASDAAYETLDGASLPIRDRRLLLVALDAARADAATATATERARIVALLRKRASEELAKSGERARNGGGVVGPETFAYAHVVLDDLAEAMEQP